MNVNRRELIQHIEFEPQSYYAAFSGEYEASSSPMWALVNHLIDPALLPLTKNVLKHCTTALSNWFDAIGVTLGDLVSLKLSGSPLIFLLFFRKSLLSRVWPFLYSGIPTKYLSTCHSIVTMHCS